MRIVFAIARQHVTRAFGQPLAWVVLALFLCWLALTTLWVDDVFAAGIASMRRPFFWMAAGLTVLAPALTMRSIAEPRRSGTLQLIGTWPVTSTQLVLGTWLGTNGVVAAALLLTISWPLALATAGPLDPGPVLAGYGALLLLGGATTAVGVATSAWSAHQVLAFLAGFTLLLLPWFLGLAIPSLPAHWSWLDGLTPQHHLDQLTRGVLDSRSVVLVASVTVVALRAAVLALEQERLK